ncbi:MAG: 2-deoxy-D-gluconate 3-dehydrogenase [Phycisphaeraceae bacterium]|nr:2-deoxy-D-gluconate 3-dehydrogenase [Phycisphaeraceae bacterium]
MSINFSLEGKQAVVTGVSTGLGSGMALGLANAGADIVGVYNAHMPDDIKKAIEATGRKFTGIQANLCDIDATKALGEQLTSLDKPVDILLNNAGIIRRNDWPDFTEADWDDVMNVNLKSIFILSQIVSKQMMANKAGKIIHIASMLSFQGGIRVPSYTASKHGVMGLTRIMANELAPYNINVNAIAPGYMATDNTQALRDDPVRNEAILARIPAGRWGDPSDLAGTAVFLASDAAKYLHGTTINVDGGWLSR